MAFSYVEFPHTVSGNVLYNFTFNYLSTSDIHVYVDNEQVSFTLPSPYTVQLDVEPALNSLVRIARETSKEDRVVDFQDGSTVTESLLDLSALQIFYIAQESYDRSVATLGFTGVVWDGQARRASNFADPLSASDLVTKQWSETSMTSSVAQALASKNAAEAAEANALAYKNDADASKSAAAANALQTGLDVVATGNNVVEAQAAQTAAEGAAAQALSDRVQTGLDVVATGNNVVEAQAAQVASELALDTFAARFLGAKESDPTLDNEGNVLLQGALYWNIPSNTLRVYNSTAWELVATLTKTSLDALGIDAASIEGLDSNTLLAGRKNYLINGNFDIWQRGTSFSSAGYSADGWRFDEGDGSSTVTRQVFSVGQADVPNEPTYFLRHDRTVAATATTAAIEQRMEGVRSLAGRTATVSFYVKAGANKTFNVDFAQTFGTGGSPSAGLAIAVGDINVTTAWQKFTFTVAFPSIAGKTIGTNNDDYLTFRIKETGSFSLFTTDIAQVQLEKGSVATDFEYRPIGEELALCKRYFRIQQGRSVIGQAESSTQIRVIHSFPEMRAAPAVSLLTPTGFDVRQGGSGFTSTSSVIASSIVQKSCYDMGVNGYSGLTQGGAITSNDSLDFLSLDASL